MRIVVFILIFLTSCCRQEIAKSELTITTIGLISKVFVLKDGKKYQTIDLMIKHDPILKELTAGTYTIIYKSVFERIEMKVVEIKEPGKYEANLKSYDVDHSEIRYNPIINRLKSNESYRIKISSLGCFEGSKDSLEIQRNNDTYTINWNNKSRILTTEEINAVRNLEKELILGKQEGCTTVDTYTINYKGNTMKFEDSSCNWGGFYRLRDQLFGKNRL